MSTIDRYIKAQEEEQLELVMPEPDRRYTLDKDGSEKYFIHEVAPIFRRGLKEALASQVSEAKIFGRGGGNIVYHDRSAIEFLIDVADRFRFRLVVGGSHYQKNDGDYDILVHGAPGGGTHSTHDGFSGDAASDAQRMVNDTIDVIEDYILLIR